MELVRRRAAARFGLPEESTTTDPSVAVTIRGAYDLSIESKRDAVDRSGELLDAERRCRHLASASGGDATQHDPFALIAVARQGAEHNPEEATSQ